MRLTEGGYEALRTRDAIRKLMEQPAPDLEADQKLLVQPRRRGCESGTKCNGDEVDLRNSRGHTIHSLNPAKI